MSLAAQSDLPSIPCRRSGEFPLHNYGTQTLTTHRQEPGSYTTNDLIESPEKMVILDKLLASMREKGSRLVDIQSDGLHLEYLRRLLSLLAIQYVFVIFDHCLIYSHQLENNTAISPRTMIASGLTSITNWAMKKSSSCSRLAMNLATADIVVLYDGDWYVLS
jgi:SWI/SNF-related matrix-associated actin-dependent regulator of chromatin subfamily A member 5